MKIIIDTNILISAILRDRVPEKVLLWIIENPLCTWIASQEIIIEYKDVLVRPKFNLPTEIIDRWFQLLDKSISLYSIEGYFDFSRDRKDAKFLLCAKETSADIFITGDGDFEEARKLISTKIVSVSTFYEKYIL